MPRVVIGCTTYNGATRVEEMLRSLFLRTPAGVGDLEVAIVLVDDGSPRVSEMQALMDLWTMRATLPLVYYQHPENRGISAGWNTATRALPCEYVVLINDDVVVPSGDWLQALIHPLKHSPLVGGVGANWHAFLDEDVAQLLDSPESDRQVVPRDPGSKAPAPERRGYEAGNPGRVMCPTGQLFAFRRADFDALGGFDEGYKSFFEESDFFTAMAKAGKIGLQLNWPMCWHRWSATFGSNPELQAHQRMSASRQRYIAKWEVPPAFHGNVPGPFDYTNPKYLGAIGDVPVEWLKQDGTVGRGILRKDGAYVDAG